MIIRIDQKSEEPLYLQLRGQIIAAIATGELVPGQALPSVRALASDLGINLHTVNKAYAVLRDEGYVLMRGRSGAYIADPCEADRADRAQWSWRRWRTSCSSWRWRIVRAAAVGASSLNARSAKPRGRTAPASVRRRGPNARRRRFKMPPHRTRRARRQWEAPYDAGL